MNALAQLRSVVASSTSALAGGAPLKSRPSLERPRQAEHGDFATNAAMVSAGAVGAPPREVAARLEPALREALGDRLVQVEIAGPGFINLRMADAWFADALAAMLADEAHGGGGAEAVQHVNVEFISANPTGPLHIGHARNAAYGDAIARILGFHGHRVTREYYVNDAGTQVRVFAASVRARARGEELPEGGYPGDYVAAVAAAIPGAADRAVEDLVRPAVDAMLERIRATAERFRIGFDVWFSEASLHEGSPSAVEKAFAEVARLAHSYTADGALWLRTTTFGDDKDRVMERSTGEHTYFSSDIAYALSKQERGFDRFIYVWGADHHGYVARVKAAFQSLGFDPERLDILIMQFVSLSEGKLSKRAGRIETLDDLIDAVGVDAARWYLLQRSHDTTIEFDLELAVSESAENPVYYVQYAHARIASILRKAGDAEAGAEPAEPLHPSERALVLALAAFGDEVAEAADRRAPHRIATYALELARSFTAFYRDCQVVGTPQQAFRLGLCVATQRTIARSLDLLGVDAPSEM